MRFEREFLALQAPRFSSDCIKYGELKNAIKIDQGKVIKKAEFPNRFPILEDLEKQCKKVDSVYDAECERLLHLHRQLSGAQKTIQANVVPSKPVCLARKHLFNAILLQAARTGEQVILFARTNADAVQRIMEKLHLACNVVGRAKELELSPWTFFTHTLASSTYDLILQIDPYVRDEKDENDISINDNDFEAVLAPFAVHSDSADEDRASSRKTTLPLIIELLGLHRLFAAKTLGDLQSDNSSRSLISRSLEKVLLSKLSLEANKLSPDVFLQSGFHDRCVFEHAAAYGLGDVLAHLKDVTGFSQAYTTATISHPGIHSRSLQLAIWSRDKLAVDQILLLNSGPGSSQARELLAPDVVCDALRAGDRAILDSILDFGVDIKEHDRVQPLLNVAIIHMPDACRTLLQHGANINHSDPVTGRTPLCLACMHGETALVELLLEYGAPYRIRDCRLWLPMEHAAYRGHLQIVKILASADKLLTHHANLDPDSLPTLPLTRTNVMRTSHIPRMQDPSVATEEYCVWITPGNNDAKNPIRALQLSGPFGYKDDLPYAISVSVVGEPNTSKQWRLPMLESSVNKPWLFRTAKIEDLKLVWQLFKYCGEETAEKGFEDRLSAGRVHSPAYEPSRKKLVATGMALMGMLDKGSRHNRESLIRDTTIPLLSQDTSSYVGQLTFSYFWSKPHPPPEHLQEPRGWTFGNGIGGHRGSGKNMIEEKKLQIGENTPQSFTTAIAHGASFLEFDVQLTKDLIPVVYHDFLISETGTDSTVQTVTYEQFKVINAVQGPKRTAKSRSNSLQSEDYQHLENFKERMNQTTFNKINGFKANTRGNFIHERSCSLEDLFRHVPTSVPLNIELKYPMLFETEDWDMEPLAIKTDIFVDTILDKVYEHAAGRSIVFSSFSPEVCIALSTKQRAFPVFFLSKTASPKGELRSCCVQQAIHFAKAWGLPGIVAECTPFIHCPRLIEYTQSAGLTVTSFGVGNSDKENVKIQFDGGIDAVISDSIRAIKELRDVAEGDSRPEHIRVYP